MKQKKAKRKSRPLVIGYLERIERKVFSDFSKQLTDLIGDQHGVYALYKRDRLYYVGLATNLRRRINHHLQDKHAGKWDRFSLYLVRKEDQIKELESLIIRISDPTGNAAKGRLPRAIDLSSDLSQNIKSEQAIRIDEIMGIKRTRSKIRPTVRKKAKSRQRDEIPLAPYVKKRFQIRRLFKGKLFKASVRKNGTINFNGTIYNTPSGASTAAINRSANGWYFWRYKNKKGEWVQLRELKI